MFYTKIWSLGFDVNPNFHVLVYLQGNLAHACGVPAVGVRAGNDVVATIFIRLFSFFFPVFLRRDLFS